VTVGGQSAQVTAVYNYAPISPYPFPANALQFTIPPGVAGNAVDVTVSTSSGSTTASGAFHYTAAVKSYPITANLQSGIYDEGRDLYYFADKAQIQVLSTTEGQWLAPIPLPGTSNQTQLLAISESPDGTKLAVSDYEGQTIYVLDPDNPASATSYPMSLDHDGFAASLAPSGVTVTNAGIVYFVTNDINGTGTPLFHELNIASATITDIGYSGGLASSGGDEFDRVLQSPDGTKVYSSVVGGVTVSYWLNTGNNEITYYTTYLSEDFPDLSISEDGTTLDVGGEWTDSTLNPETEVVYIDWETWFPLAANGQKLNGDGNVIFSPLTDGIDILDSDTGRLLYRIQIPVMPANVYDVLVVPKGQDTLAVISANAVSLVDLSSLSLPAVRGSRSVRGTRNSRSQRRSSTRLQSPRSHLFSHRSRLRHRS
jgi:hypothetical protein